MENASNALIMAASVLIAIMIISIGVILFKGSANFVKDYEEANIAVNLQNFNNKFEIYRNKSELNIQDIVSVINLAQQINEETDVGHNSDLYIHVILDLEHIESLRKGDIYNIMQENTDSKYKCKEIIYNENTQRVNIIKFEKL